MARSRRRRRKSDYAKLTYDQKRELLYGQPMITDNCFFDDDEMRKAWNYHRDKLLAEWCLAAMSGTRPFAAWLFDYVPKFGERRTTTAWERLAPFRENWLTHGILHTHLLPPVQEPEHEYLYRHKLIDDMEYREAVEGFGYWFEIHRPMLERIAAR